MLTLLTRPDYRARGLAGGGVGDRMCRIGRLCHPGVRLPQVRNRFCAGWLLGMYGTFSWRGSCKASGTPVRFVIPFPQAEPLVPSNPGRTMSRYQWELLDDPDQVPQHAIAWNDLWWRSDTPWPLARAEVLPLWLEHFAPEAALRVVIVRRRSGAWAACLPLISGRVGRWFPVGRLPGNAWAGAGDLLLDPVAVKEPEFWQALREALAHLPWRVLWLEDLPVESPRWQWWQRQIPQEKLACDACQHVPVGITELEGDWDHFLRTRSRNFRKSLRRCRQSLARLGEVELLTHLDSPCSAQELMEMVKEVERRSWKFQAGTALVQHPHVEAFFDRWTQLLDQSSHLAVFVLRVGQRPVAYEWGYVAKGTYFSHKCSFDQQLGEHSPGHVLCAMVLQRLFDQPGVHRVDYLGPMTEAIRRWSTGHYWSGRVVCGRGVGRAAVAAHRHLLPWWRRLRRRELSAPPQTVPIGLAPAETSAPLPMESSS